MPAPIFVRPPTEQERPRLLAGLRSSDAFTLRRCQMILASARGHKAGVIAQQVGVSDETVRQVIHGFNSQGVSVLTPRSRRPHTSRPAFDAHGLEALRALLHRSPRSFGKATSLWTLALVAEVSFEQGLTQTRVSRETIRKSLARLQISWKRAKHWIQSPDPSYTRKKTDGTA